MENEPFIGGLPVKILIFPMAMSNYQRVSDTNVMRLTSAIALMISPFVAERFKSPPVMFVGWENPIKYSK